MNENLKYYNSFLVKIIKFVEKILTEIDLKQRQLIIYKSTETEQSALQFSKERIGKIHSHLLRAKDQLALNSGGR